MLNKVLNHPQLNYKACTAIAKTSVHKTVRVSSLIRHQPQSGIVNGWFG